jgi:hypothetical protein
VRPIHLTFPLVKTSQTNKQRNEDYESLNEVCSERNKFRNSPYNSVIKSVTFCLKSFLFCVAHVPLFHPSRSLCTFHQAKLPCHSVSATQWPPHPERNVLLTVSKHCDKHDTNMACISNFTVAISMNINLYSTVVTIYTACNIVQ